MKEYNNYKFEYADGQELVLKNPSGVFTPTGTTSALVKAANAYITKPGKLLDLGCGNGVAGIALHQLGFVKEPLYASDLSYDAVEVVIENAALYKCSVISKQGSIFEPWEHEKFDYILNDISGVAQRVAEVSPWFDSVPCASGEDGAELVITMLKEATEHLNKNGLLFFPVISLSNIERIIAEAKNNFSNVKCLSSDEWPLPKEMNIHQDMLDELAAENIINFSRKFGMLTYTTDIYVAYN